MSNPVIPPAHAVPAYGVSPQPPFIGVPLYAATLNAAVARNDLDALNGLICQAQGYLDTYGDLPSLIEQLKTEIAKLER